MNSSIVVAALYKFVALDNFQEMRQPMLAAMQRFAIKGTLLLAREGINGTVSGERAGMDGFLAWLTADPRLADLEHKESFFDENPFYRSKVKLKTEIVTLGVESVDPTQTSAPMWKHGSGMR